MIGGRFDSHSKLSRKSKKTNITTESTIKLRPTSETNNSKCSFIILVLFSTVAKKDNLLIS